MPTRACYFLCLGGVQRVLRKYPRVCMPVACRLAFNICFIPGAWYLRGDLRCPVLLFRPSVDPNPALRCNPPRGWTIKYSRKQGNWIAYIRRHIYQFLGEFFTAVTRIFLCPVSLFLSVCRRSHAIVKGSTLLLLLLLIITLPPLRLSAASADYCERMRVF